MRAKDLLQRLEDHPFRPFRVHLSDGTILAIAEPLMVIVSDTTAIIPTEFFRDRDGMRVARHWRTVDLLHIVQFSEASETNGRRRRSKR